MSEIKPMICPRCHASGIVAAPDAGGDGLVKELEELAGWMIKTYGDQGYDDCIMRAAAALTAAQAEIEALNEDVSSRGRSIMSCENALTAAKERERGLVEAIETAIARFELLAMVGASELRAAIARA